jgi:hypothetical protein
LIRAPLSITSVLDESAEVVAVAAPWTAVLVLTSLPYRLAQILFVDRVFEAGSEAVRYGNVLGRTANLAIAAFLLSLFGRAVFARACRLAAQRGRTPGREAWRVAPAAFAVYLLTASTGLLLWFLALPTVVGLLVAVLFSGLAIGTMELNERAGVLDPFRLILRYAKRVAIPIALTLVFLVAFFLALLNVTVAFQAGVWLASALGGFDAPHWDLLFGFGNRRFVLLMIAGAVIAVEPFWVAAQVMFVRKAGAEESGEDLRVWLDELREAS